MLHKYIGTTVMSIALFSLATSAHAQVKYAKISDDGVSTPTIEVFQTEDPNGQLRYTTLKAGNYLDPTVNIGVKVSAQCKWGYELSRTFLENNDLGDDLQKYYDYWGTGIVPNSPSYSPIVSLPIVLQDFPFTNGNRTLGERVEYLRLPVGSFEPLIDYGNEWVAAHSDSIIQENNIRANDWTAFLNQPVGFAVRCKRVVGYTGLDKWWGNATYDKPIRVVYRGKSAEFDLINLAPGQGAHFDPALPNGQLGDTVNVDASLLIVENEETECTLDLSATFTTNGETVIFYYLVNDRGVVSPLYKTAVDQTHTAFVYHPIDLSEQEPEIVFPADTRQLSAVPTDRLQGFYQIEVVSPHKTMSNIASYNIEPCITKPNTIRDIVSQ